MSALRDGRAMDHEWHRLMREAMAGERRSDRTGVGTTAVFGVHARWDLREGFPACTTKKLYFGQVRAELAAFLRPCESIDEYNALGCTIWDKNASDPRWKERQRFPGDVGRLYGVQWRRWRSVMFKGRGFMEGEPLFRELDQIALLVQGLRADPHGRRHVVTAWNPGELEQMCLPPCHVMFQCFASDERTFLPDGVEAACLDLHFHMRSLDLFLGMPFDVASYALLLHLIAKSTSRAPRYLVMTAGDAHVYTNHVGLAEVAMGREPRRSPRLILSESSPLFAFLPEDARLHDYDPHPAIPAPMNN